MQQSFNWHTAEVDEPYRAIAFQVVLLRSTMAWWPDRFACLRTMLTNCITTTWPGGFERVQFPYMFVCSPVVVIFPGGFESGSIPDKIKVYGNSVVRRKQTVFFW